MVGKYRIVVHAMVPTTDAITNYPDFDNQKWKPACGRPMRTDKGVLKLELHPDDQLCQHAACTKLWNHFELGIE